MAGPDASEPAMVAAPPAAPAGEGAPPQSRLVSNTLVQLAPPAVRTLAGLAVAAVLARYLGVEGYGQYGLAIAFVLTFSGIFSDWGLSTITLREISRRPQDTQRLLRSAASLQLLIAAVSYILMVGAVQLTAYPAAVKLGVAVFGLSIFLSAVDLLTLPFQAELRVARLIVPGVGGPLLGLVLTLAVVATHGSVVMVLAAWTASLLLQYLAIAILVFRFHAPVRGPMTTHWKHLLSSSWPLGVSTVFSTLQQQLPLLVLSAVSLAAVGLYTAAAKLPLQLVLLPLIVRNSTFPLLSRSWSSDRTRFLEQLSRLMKIASMAAVVAGLLGAGLAALVVRVLFGARFAGAAPAFAWLMVMAAVLVPGILVGEALIAAGYQRVNMIVQAAALPVMAVLLFVLARMFGGAGAAAATAITYFLFVAAEFVVAAQVLGPLEPLRWSSGALASLVAGGACLFFLRGTGVVGVIAAALVALVVAAVLERETVGWLLRRTLSARSVAPVAGGRA